MVPCVRKMSTQQRSDVNSISEDTAIDPNAVCESDEEHIDEAYTEGNVSEFGDMNCTYELYITSLRRIEQIMNL